MERDLAEDLKRPTLIIWQKIWPLSSLTGRNGETMSSKAELARPDDDEIWSTKYEADYHEL